MAQDKPFPNLGGLTYSEDVFWRLFDDLFAVGVVGSATDYQVIQNHLGANMSVDVNPGSAYVALTNGGKRRLRLPAQSNSGTPGTPNAADNWLTTFLAADATNPRIDRVVLTVRDTSIDGTGASDSALRVIAGTPTSGATLANLNGAAAVPANSMLLANVLVPNAATTVVTGNIADQRAVSKIGGNLSAGASAASLALNVSAANTDLAAPAGSVGYFAIGTGGGSLRSIGAASAGATLTIRNTTAALVRLLHATAGGTGAQLSIIGAGHKFLPPGGTITLAYDGTVWQEIDRPGMELICDLTLGGSQASFDTDTILGVAASIPQVYNHLRLVYMGRSDTAATNSSTSIRFNNDSAANYDYGALQGSSGTPSNSEGIGQTLGYAGEMAAATAVAGATGSVDILIEAYAQATFHKQAIATSIMKYGIAAGNLQQHLHGIHWRSTAAITRIQAILSAGNFIAGSRFSLYGIT